MLGPVGYVREPAAPARLLNAATVVPDEHRQHPGVRVHHDVDAVGPRVPRRVGQRLAQHGEHLLGELAAGARVEPAAEPHRGREPEHLRHLVGERHDVGPQPGHAGPAAGLQGEDRRPDVPDRVVHRVHGVAHPVGDLAPGDHWHRALKRHARGVQPLNHQVMQVPGDPVPVLEHGKALGVGPAVRELKRDGRLGGERRDDAGRALLERRAALDAPHGEHAAHVARRAEREQGRRADVSHRQPRHVGRARVLGEVLDRDRRTARQDLTGQ
ncbi:MAG: hypothetical protein QOH87_965 [Trebonia sp.]|nr:hypothetical protein [Trebonia sp.]